MLFQFYTVAEVLPDMAETLDLLYKLRTGEQPGTKVKCIF